LIEGRWWLKERDWSINWREGSM